jgi:hypothetical protein
MTLLSLSTAIARWLRQIFRSALRAVPVVVAHVAGVARQALNRNSRQDQARVTHVTDNLFSARVQISKRDI